MPKGKPNLSYWNQVKAPNHGSEKATVASNKIDLWYARLQVYERWTWPRFVKLAVFLNLTPEELASVVCIPHSRLAMYERENRIKIHCSSDRSAALVLTMLEAHCCKHLTKDVIENPFPDLNKL